MRAIKIEIMDIDLYLDYEVVKENGTSMILLIFWYKHNIDKRFKVIFSRRELNAFYNGKFNKNIIDLYNNAKYDLRLHKINQLL